MISPERTMSRVSAGPMAKKSWRLGAIRPSTEMPRFTANTKTSRGPAREMPEYMVLPTASTMRELLLTGSTRVPGGTARSESASTSMHWRCMPAPRKTPVPSHTATLPMAPGDMLTVQIYELYNQGVWHVSTRRIDAGGFFRLPEIGDVQAAGMTAQQFEDRISELLDQQVIQDPLVDVVVEDGGGFTYTLYGSVRAPGMYALRSPDLRLLDVRERRSDQRSQLPWHRVVEQSCLADQPRLFRC